MHYMRMCVWSRPDRAKLGGPNGVSPDVDNPGVGENGPRSARRDARRTLRQEKAL